MHKWHVHSCIGRGRPLPSSVHASRKLAHPSHHFHSAPLLSQEANQARVSNEQPQPILSRAQRLQNATKQMENLYYKHAAGDNGVPGQAATPFRSVPPRDTANRQAANLTEQSAGAPLSQAVLEGRKNTPSSQNMQASVTRQPRTRREVVDVSPAAMEARVSGAMRGSRNERGTFRRVKYADDGGRDTNARPPPSGAANAGNMGAMRPEQQPREIHRNRQASPRESVDARPSRARAEGVGSSRDTIMRSFRPEGGFRSGDSSTAIEDNQTSPPRRQSSFRRDEPRNSDGMQERQRFSTQGERSFNVDQAESQDGIEERASRFIRDAPRKGGGFRSSPQGSDNGIQERAVQNFQGRSMFNRAPRDGSSPQRSGRAGRPRAARDGDETERRPRKGRNSRVGGSSGGNDRDDGRRPNLPIWNEEEEEYFAQKRKAEAPQSLPFEPGNITPETYSGAGPPIASSAFGMSEMLGERLLLAKKYLEKAFIQWDSKEQKADVMTLVARLGTVQGQENNDQNNKKGEIIPPKTAKQTEELMQKLFGGKYEMVKPRQGKDILGNVAMHIDRNESYFPDDQRILLEKVRSILPADTGKGGEKRSKQRA
ncbi:hypothetical protein P7C71_g6461, partial [Lecanoromycetidae sp. Uapishka_2]